MRDLREEDFVIIVVAVCCTIIMGIGLVDSKIKTWNLLIQYPLL